MYKIRDMLNQHAVACLQKKCDRKNRMSKLQTARVRNVSVTYVLRNVNSHLSKLHLPRQQQAVLKGIRAADREF